MSNRRGTKTQALARVCAFFHAVTQFNKGRKVEYTGRKPFIITEGKEE